MAFGYRCDRYEATELRELFGPRVATVCFWDAEEGGGRFSLVEAFDTDRVLIAQVRGGDAGIRRLEEIAAGRALTVTFFLEL